jgi:outer membrane lipoprotein SlyB
MDSISPSQPAATLGKPTRALWAAICVLAAAVAALGGALIHKEVGDAAPQSAPIAALAGAPQPVRAPDDFAPPAVQQAVPAQPPAGAVQAPPPVRAPQVIAPRVAQAETVPAAAPGPAPAPAPQAAKPCAICGHVESVRKIERPKPTTGVGAVAGGVVGGLVGNQIGSGTGRTVATVAGAVGGGFAGNAIEKKVHTDTVYQVNVRMQNGSLRTVETAAAPPIGEPVTLKGNVLRPANGPQ